MRTAPLLTVSCSAGGGVCPTPPLDADPHPWMQTLPDPDPPDPDFPGHVTCDAFWEANPTVNRMTHRCKNITFPQTSFAGGNESLDVRHIVKSSQNFLSPPKRQKLLNFLQGRMTPSHIKVHLKTTHVSVCVRISP